MMNGSCGFYRAFGLIIFVFLQYFVYSEYAGDPCTLRRTNATGRCKFLSECREAVEDLRSRGLSLQICGFDGVRPIVCCVENTSNTKPFPTTKSKTNQRESCTLRRTNAPGHCILLSECRAAVDDLRSRGISPQTCGFDGVLPIVCCVEKTSTTKPFPTKRSKSEQKCKKYREEYAKNIAITPLPGLHVPIKEECNFLDWSFIQSNIARPKEFPHLAAIGYDGEKNDKAWLCSGALISEQFVLTAAHCLTDRPHGEPKYIRIGDLDPDSYLDKENAQDFNVAEIFIHPDFEPPSFYNDIGLLKMDRNANFNSYVRPACINTNPNLADRGLTVAAWGKGIGGSDISSHLIKESLRFLSHAECENFYKKSNSSKRLSNGILDKKQLCVWLQRNENTCVMGTGSLQVYNKEQYCMYTIAGVTSFGRTCRNSEVPDVFTRVSAYTEWIEGIVWPS